VSEIDGNALAGLEIYFLLYPVYELSNTLLELRGPQMALVGIVRLGPKSIL
jgi:hypothetical protein